jgi:hypothetical protein
MKFGMASATKRRREEEICDLEPCCEQIDCDRCWLPGEDGMVAYDGAVRATTSPIKKHRGQSDCAGSGCGQTGCTGCTLPDFPSPSLPHMDMVDELDPDAIRNIVKILAAESPFAQSLVRAAYQQRAQMSRSEATDFGPCKRGVEAVFSSRSERYSASGQGYSDVRSCIDTVGQQVGPQSSYDAKKSALEALHDISLSILRADGCRQAIEVKNEFERDDCIPQLMLQIVRSMSSDEQARVGAEYTPYGSTLVESLRYVHEKAVEQYTAGFYDLSLVLDMLDRNALG